LKILSIDTSGSPGSIAVIEGAEIVEEVVLPAGDRLDEVLFQQIQTLLARHGWQLADVDGFAAASGPGTFTGVRGGLTVVKGLAEATARKVVAVSNLKAMAHFGTGPLRATWIDARRGEIYGAVYDAALQAVRDEVVMKHDAWLASLPAGAEIISTPRPLAGAMGKIAALEFAAGRGLDPAAVDANYVRRSDAEQMWKDVRGG
jgi:tRNA threonylcarbamoyladenosine biosynthesis protein TsaB